MSQINKKPLLYHVIGSPPAHAVRLVAAALNLELDLVSVETTAGEQLKPEFLALNPQHTVPTLVDTDGRAIWDSHAISTYLIGKYGGSADHPLYPADLYTRARIDQRLHFDSSIVFIAIRNYMRSRVRGADAKSSAEQLAEVHAVYDTLELFLAKDPFLVGDALTVADLSVISTVTTGLDFVPLDADKYPKTAAWIGRVGQQPYFADSLTRNVADGLVRINGIVAKYLAAAAADKK